MLARKLTAASARAVAPWWRAGGAPEPVAVYQPIGAASLAASYVNLANPGVFDAAPGVAPDFDAAIGWIDPNGTRWLDTGIVIDAVSTWSVFIRFVRGDVGFRQMFGAVNALNQGFAIDVGRDSDTRFGFRNCGYSGGPGGNSPASGVVAIAGNQAYFNGVDAGIVIPAGTAPTLSLRLMGMAGVANNFLGSKQAVAIYDTALTASKVAAVSAAMAAV